jgi:hypothetical protein
MRKVQPNGRMEIVIFVEDAGNFTVALAAVDSVHDEKVVVNCGKLEHKLRAMGMNTKTRTFDGGDPPLRRNRLARAKRTQSMCSTIRKGSNG